jgi:hypothetical protein
MNFPPNSQASREEPQEQKRVERVTRSEAIRKKKPLRKQFAETFVSGDAKSAVHYVLFDVLIPAAKDMIAEAGSAGIEKLIFGDSRRKRGTTPPMAGPTGYIQYNRMSPQTAPQRALSRRARSRHDFDEIVLPQRTEAEDVIDRLFDLVGRYESATVADLYDLVGLEAAHTDQKWGWRNLRGSGVSRVRDGYLLDLPEPEPLDQ